jgi:hypothetical protein
MCGSYPQQFAVPASVQDVDLVRDAQLCAGGRVPMLLLLRSSGAALLACGQVGAVARLATIAAYLAATPEVCRVWWVCDNVHCDAMVQQSQQLLVVNLPVVERRGVAIVDADWQASESDSVTDSAMFDVELDADDDAYVGVPLPLPPGAVAEPKANKSSSSSSSTSSFRRAMSDGRKRVRLCFEYIVCCVD